MIGERESLAEIADPMGVVLGLIPVTNPVSTLVFKTLICMPRRPTRRTTAALMHHPGVSMILATAGTAMVKAAYSSGTPPIGVGPGNAPAWVCADADLEAAAQMVVARLLGNGGAGHTAVIHARSQRLQLSFARQMPVSRILVNSPAAQGCIGMGNGLTPSLTLGCGTYGRTSTTDNVTYTNLINVKRMAQPRP